MVVVRDIKRRHWDEWILGHLHALISVSLLVVQSVVYMRKESETAEVGGVQIVFIIIQRLEKHVL